MGCRFMRTALPSCRVITHCFMRILMILPFAFRHMAAFLCMSLFQRFVNHLKTRLITARVIRACRAGRSISVGAALTAVLERVIGDRPTRATTTYCSKSSFFNFVCVQRATPFPVPPGSQKPVP